jgi:dihydroflavonol-4-reductase
MSDALGHGRTILVTGGSGYLGSWVIVTLLRQGFRVRTTIRDLAKEGQVRSMIAGQVYREDRSPEDRLTFSPADLLKDEGWARAADGCDSVIHVASPLPFGEFRKADIITPARQGTRRVLEAAARCGVKRVVLTSSVRAALPLIGESATVDETRWTERPDEPIYQYAHAKTLAERDAWAFVREYGGLMELTTVLPGFILGPVMGSDYSGSVHVVGLMLGGKMPVVPRIGFGIVDVRDVADLHVRAMLSPAAAGERFLAAGDFLWLSDMAAILHQKLGSKAAKAPRRVMPDWLVRLLALFNAEMAQIAPDLGVRREIDASKAERLLAWKTRPAAESIVDAANGLIERGLV